MAHHAKDMNEERQIAGSRADFIELAGIGSDLEDFLREFSARPEIFYSMPRARRREIECQMDAILSLFGK